MTRYLKLENITGRFNVPCVMDIKIGKVTWDDGVDEQFKERRRKKWPLKEITGFSILGFMVCYLPNKRLYIPSHLPKRSQGYCPVRHH